MIATCSLRSQRNNRQNALAVDSVDGKAGEKGCIFTVLWRWNNRIYDRAFSCKGKGVATTNDCRFFWKAQKTTNKTPHPLGCLQKAEKRKVEKKRIVPLLRDKTKGSVITYGYFIPVTWCDICFLSIFPLMGPMMGAVYSLFLWNFKK